MDSCNAKKKSSKLGPKLTDLAFRPLLWFSLLMVLHLSADLRAFYLISHPAISILKIYKLQDDKKGNAL
jgi:hypothetical protein